MKAALIGCGSIGTFIAKSIRTGKLNVELKYVYNVRKEAAEKFAKRFQIEYKDFDQILEEDLDLVIEAASQEAVRNLVPRALKAKKNVMVMSTGAFVDEDFYCEIKDLAKRNNLKVYMPSGAIAGLDGIKAANIGKIEKVTLRTRKPPKSLKGAPFFRNRSIDLNSIKSAKIIFEGSAEEAAQLFPSNLNIAASLGLAGVGPKHTTVQIIVDPDVGFNIHEITAHGSFGMIMSRTQNVPSSSNPRTSDLAALSAVATLKRISEPIEIGT